MQRRDVRERRHSGVGTPIEKLGHGAAVGSAGVRVADVGGEEFQEANAGMLAGGGDQDRNEGATGWRRQWGELIHASYHTTRLCLIKDIIKYS